MTNLSVMTADRMQIATFGGGCFWCLEAVFQRVAGVQTVVSGYAGGHVKDPTYDHVCMGNTGHAEVIQIHFDSSVVSFADLLDVFFLIHDPTTLNRQGNDVGTQYRSVIFTSSDEQEKVASDFIAKLTAEKHWSDPVVTEILPLPTFYPAEEYHQNYFNDHADQPYCQLVILPKLQKYLNKVS